MTLEERIRIVDVLSALLGYSQGAAWTSFNGQGFSDAEAEAKAEAISEHKRARELLNDLVKGAP